MPVSFNGEVLAVSVKSKKIKQKTGDVTYEDVQKVGRITIEFDGDSVDVTALAELTHGRSITLELEDTQRNFLRNIDRTTGEIKAEA